MNKVYINKMDQLGESSYVGKKAEDLFENWLKRKKREYRPATIEEQYQHIDFVISSKKLNKDINIDVKATKKKTRMDSSSNSNYVWIEFKNIHGKEGWLYGKADYIAFHDEVKNIFYLIDRKELVKRCEEICDDKIVDNPREALYHKYTRKGRKDVLSLIYLDDILSCKHYII